MRAIGGVTGICDGIDQLAQQIVLGPALERDPDSIGSEELGQLQTSTSKADQVFIVAAAVKLTGMMKAQQTIFCRWARTASTTIVAGALCVSGAGAQRLLDWAVRTSAQPDALAGGAAAAFWNPAALGTGGYSAEVVVINLRTPEAIGLSGFAGAASAAVDRTTFAVAYEQVNMGEITLTDDRPDETSTLSLSEDHFTLAARRALGSNFGIGAVARYTRDNVNNTDPVVGLGVGAHLTRPGRYAPQVGGFVISEQDVAAWGAGAEARLPFAPADYRVGVAYGASGRSDTFTTHRVSLSADWREYASVSGGIAREGSGDDAQWQPILAASLRFSRYALGIVRETLSNEFGAAYSFRLQVGIGRSE